MLGEKLTQLRKNKKVSQEELADILMTSRQAVSKWERGESYPDIDRLKDLAIYYNVSIDYLLDYDLEAVSVNGFISRLEKCMDERDFSITEDEISAIVSKNSNNFNLLIPSIGYLTDYWANHRTDKIIDLIIDYCNKAILLFQPNNRFKISIPDLQVIVADTYVLKEKWEEARNFIRNNNVKGIETLLATCEIELGNYDEATDILSTSYMQSAVKIVDGNTSQIHLLMRKNDLQEALDLSNWTISFIKSISNNDQYFLDVIFTIAFMKATCEKRLNLDNSSTINYLKENKDKIGSGVESSSNMKFYYGKKIDFVTLVGDVRVMIKKKLCEISKTVDTTDAIEIYKQIFGEY